MKIEFERLNRFGRNELIPVNDAARHAIQLARRKIFREKELHLLEKLGHEIVITPYIFREGEYRKGAKGI
jgi:hypothetical protein